MIKTVQSKKTCWVPIQFNKVGGHYIVQLVDASALDLSLGFFKDSLSKLKPSKDFFRIIALTTWLEEQRSDSFDCEQHSPAIIFHISRCGSTLLCQNLKKTDKFIVLGEPKFMHHLYVADNQIPSTLKTQVAHATMTVWNKWTKHQNKKLVIKLSSSLNQSHTDILADFPVSKVLFLYREPIAVIESLVRKPPQHIRQNTKNLTDKNKQQECLLRATKHYKSSIQILPKVAQKNIASIEYTMLKHYFSSITNYFLGPTIISSYLYQWDTQWNSKYATSAQQQYHPVTKQQIKHFYLENKSFIDSIMPCYKNITSFPPQNNGEKT